MHYSISVGIKPLDSDKLCEPIENGILLNKTILDEHHDFPTLLNNFYLLGFFNRETGLHWLVANE